jgi:hypothetical protein
MTSFNVHDVGCFILYSQLVGKNSWRCRHIDYLIAECRRYFFESLLFGLTVCHVSDQVPVQSRQDLIRIEEINDEKVNRAASDEDIVVVFVNICERRRASFSD